MRQILLKIFVIVKQKMQNETNGTFGDGDRMSHSISLNNIVNNIYSY